jgi:hypothetical protein
MTLYTGNPNKVYINGAPLSDTIYTGSGNSDFAGFSMGEYISTGSPELNLQCSGSPYVDQGAGGLTFTVTGSPVQVIEDEFATYQGKMLTTVAGGLTLSTAETTSGGYFTNGDLTIIALVRIKNQGGAYQTIMTFREPSSMTFQWFGFVGLRFEYWQSSTRLVQLSNCGLFRQWAVYAIRRESNVMSVFRNGYQYGPDSGTLAVPSSGVEKLSIGTDPSGNNMWGDFGYAAMYHSALSDAKILEYSNLLLP